MATYKDQLENCVKKIIKQAYDAANGNVTAAAGELGLSRPGFYKLMKRTKMKPIVCTACGRKRLGNCLCLWDYKLEVTNT